MVKQPLKEIFFPKAAISRASGSKNLSITSRNSNWFTVLTRFVRHILFQPLSVLSVLDNFCGTVVVVLGFSVKFDTSVAFRLTFGSGTSLYRCGFFRGERLKNRKQISRSLQQGL